MCLSKFFLAGQLTSQRELIPRSDSTWCMACEAWRGKWSYHACLSHTKPHHQSVLSMLRNLNQYVSIPNMNYQANTWHDKKTR